MITTPIAMILVIYIYTFILVDVVIVWNPQFSIRTNEMNYTDNI